MAMTSIVSAASRDQAHRLVTPLHPFISVRLSRATLRPRYGPSYIAPGTVNGAMKAVAVAIPSPTWRRDGHRLLRVQNCRRFFCNAVVAMLSLVGMPTASRPRKTIVD